MYDVGVDMLLKLAIIFLIIAIVAYILGARRIAGLTMEIAWILVVIFVILALIAFLTVTGILTF